LLLEGENQMKFKFLHNNLNVVDLKRSLAFYKQALDLDEVRRMERPEFTLVYLGDGVTAHQLELTEIKGRTEAYNLGENEIHLAFSVEDFAAAYKLHEEMGCICYENKKMGIYFISDPDGYWLEVLPANR